MPTYLVVHPHLGRDHPPWVQRQLDERVGVEDLRRRGPEHLRDPHPPPALNVSILLVARTKHAPGILIWVFGGLRRHLVQGVRVGGGQDLPGAHGEHAKPDPQEEVTAGRVVALQGR